MYERIYSIGCFNYFHKGHIALLNKMRKYGKELIIGIHDDSSIKQIKNSSQEKHQPIEIRLKNVKKYADRVYVIPSKDPSFFLKCMLLETDNKKNACYIRADNIKNFPGKQIVENKIDIKFLPYTIGINPAEIRKFLMDNKSMKIN
jgi:cytidyltransferase-like protein